MDCRSKFFRLIRNEYLPETIIAIVVIIIIHICNKFYEYTGNQYVLIDNDQLNEFCPLYPSTLRGKMNVDDICLVYDNLSIIGSKEKIIIPEYIEWSDNPNVQIGMLIY